MLGIAFLAGIFTLAFLLLRLKQLSERQNKADKSYEILRVRLQIIEQRLAGESDAERKHFTFAPVIPEDKVEDSPTHSPPPATTSSSSYRTSEPAPSLTSWNAPLSTSEPWDVLRNSPIWKMLEGYFTRGNIVARIGIIVLFFGVAFLLKYAADRNIVPIELRLLGIATAGLFLLALGWRLRTSREMFSLALQGGGLGILYLTGFAALRLYHLISPEFAFGVFVALGLFTALLAIYQNAHSLAVLGVSGAFLAPVLASTGSGSHVALFGYYALLNAAILGISWFKHWRSLAVTGFLFTFVIGTTWGYHYYQPDFFPTTEPFLIFFFLVYVVIGLLLALYESGVKDRLVGLLIFGTPAISFTLQAGLVYDYEYGLAWSAFALGVFYLVLGWLTHKGAGNTHSARPGLLTQAFLALGVVFNTLAIPYALDNQTTAAIWVLEGAGIVWLGTAQRHKVSRWFGLLLQFAAAVLFLDHYQTNYHLAVLNTNYLSSLMISLAAFYSGYLLLRNKDRLLPWEHTLNGLLFFWGALWWFAAGLNEISLYVKDVYHQYSALAFIALSCALFEWVGARFSIRLMRYPAALLGLVMTLFLFPMMVTLAHPFEAGGYLAWPLAFAVHYWALYRHEQSPIGGVFPLRHAAALWLLTILLAWELAWQVDTLVAGADIWPLSAWCWLPAMILLVIPKLRRPYWPFAEYAENYLTLGLAPVALFIGLWSLYLNLNHSGDATPLSYYPIFNPLDLSQLLALVALGAWLIQLKKLPPNRLALSPTRLAFALAALALLWVSMLLARTVHHWLGVDFEFENLLHSVILQAALALLWTLIGLTAMLYATRTQRRIVWLTGGALLGVVVAKLFLVDLANTGTVARIVSFLGVGSLLLVVGYVSPAPPRIQLPESRAGV